MKKDLKHLQLKMQALCVFKSVFCDETIFALYNLIDAINHQKESQVILYSDFLEKLYFKGGNLTEHVKSVVFASENVYVKTIGAKKEVPEFLTEQVKVELKTLSEISSLSFHDLTESFDKSISYGVFISEKVDFEKEYFHRALNIEKYGYGKFSQNKMFYLADSGEIIPVKNPDKTKLSDLIDYERERKIVIDNTLSLLDKKPALNVLLTGDAGTGKSSTVKAIVNEFFDKGLRIIEIRKDQLKKIPKLLDDLSENPLKFILFIDDLSFSNDDDNFNALKAVLEGSVSSKSENVVIYATSNRRHIVKEKFSDREGDDIHANDTMQEIISLSERFGIWVSFQKPSKATYLEIIFHLAKVKGLKISEGELELLGERYALERGGRSCRLARQFVDSLLAK